MKIGELIQQYLDAHQMSQRKFAQKTGLTNGYISMLIKDNNPKTNAPISPSADSLVKIAHGLDMTIAELIQKTDDHIFGELSFEEASALLERDINEKAASVRIPVLGTIPAGIPIEAIEEILDWEEAPADWARGGKEYFALKITGDSMEPEYRAGDVVIFRRQDDCESGDDCAVLVNGNDATFKRVRKSEKGVTLMPLNPAYEPMFYSVQEADELPIRVLGVVVQLRREPKRGRV